MYPVWFHLFVRFKIDPTRCSADQTVRRSFDGPFRAIVGGNQSYLANFMDQDRHSFPDHERMYVNVPRKIIIL